jgi:hypothetical protein
MCDCILLQRKIENTCGENCVYDGKMKITGIYEIYKVFASIYIVFKIKKLYLQLLYLVNL